MEIHVEIFPWSANFETGIALIDEQHKQLVHLLNVLVEHLAFQSDSPTIDKIFEQLKEYVEFHFATEEAIWKKHFEGDSWEKWHILAHTDFISKVKNMREDSNGRSQDEVIEKIVQFLTHWLAQHILDNDKRMAKVVLALPSGISLARAKKIANEEMTGIARVLIETVMSMYDKLASNTLMMSREIKRRQQAEAEMQRAKEAADAANRAKSIFLANMSHELRTPLNAILGFSELLSRDETLSASQKETLNIINRSGAHLLNVINDVLDISKIEAGRQELDIQVFDLPTLLRNIGDMISVRAANSQLSFRLEISPDIPQYIKTDSGKLRQVLINLLGNAIKFTQQGGIILRVNTLSSASAETTRLAIEIMDSGIGIPQNKLNDLFKPFTQLEQISPTQKGTGLGLAISKSLINLMGGSISVNSEFGIGSTFKVELAVPIASAKEMAVADELHFVKTLAPNQPQWRLLIVDDNSDNRLLLVKILTEVGFQVYEAENGQEAILAFEHWHPHLIWMDMRMLVMDGYAAATRIRQLPNGGMVKIIALTASAFAEQHQGIINSGCDAVLHKPFQVPEIFAVLTKHLGVEFIYQDISPKAPSELEPTFEMISKLPAQLRQKLREAALSLDIDETDAVIAQIRILAPDIANGLQELAQGYQFEQIVWVTD